VNLPILMQKLYGEITFTGLYSFEFKNKGKKITEIFFMMPPKSKDVSESTRSATIPTLSSNYVIDAGNSTKSISLNGELYFPTVGSPVNPVAMDSANLPNLIDGLTEFFKLKWMLISYRDYTMTKNGKIDVPTVPMNSSPELTTLYKKVSKLVKNKSGALYDQIQLIFHDYDMDDHYFCRIANFSSKQSDSKYIAVEYNISLDCYKKYQSNTQKSVTIKKTISEELNISNTQLQNVSLATIVSNMNAAGSSSGAVFNNATFYALILSIENTIASIDTENTNIQSGVSTPFDNMLLYTLNLISDITSVMNAYITLFLTEAQQTLYADGDLTLDEILDITLIALYNSFLKIKIIAETIKGSIISAPRQNTISYNSNSDDYTITTEQFDSTDSTNKISNESSFEYYTIKEGDSARSIALSELGDSEKFVQILQINDITESELIEGTLIGTQIKIPVDSTSVTKSADNLVYESDDTDIEAYLHGSDISSGVNNTILISSKGDIANVSGADNTINAITARVSGKKGSLNVFSSDWGVTPIGDGNVPLMVRINNYLTDLTNQIQEDPRVESVNIDMDKLYLDGEKLSVYAKVLLIGSEEEKEIIVA